MGELYTGRLIVSMFQTNCYIVMDSETCEGYVIDPGSEPGKIMKAAESAGLECLGVLCTHGHMDHVGAAKKVADRTGAPVFVNRNDSAVLKGEARGLGDRLGSLVVSRPSRVEDLNEGDELGFGEHVIETRATPGHTPGSVSFVCGDRIFCGDLLFQGSVGRTDLKGGSMKELLDSVKNKVFTLPDDTVVLPGHGPATTVAEEKRRNPFLRGLDGGRDDG